MDLIANNLANSETTRTPEGGPYRKQSAVFTVKQAQDTKIGADPSAEGVEVAGIVADTGDPRLVHSPGHPDADANGYVAMPDINPMEEMVDMISATRAYEANAAAIGAAKTMFAAALDLGRG